MCALSERYVLKEIYKDFKSVYYVYIILTIDWL